MSLYKEYFSKPHMQILKDLKDTQHCSEKKLKFFVLALTTFYKRENRVCCVMMLIYYLSMPILDTNISHTCIYNIMQHQTFIT